MLELLRQKLPQLKNDRQRIVVWLRYFCKFDDHLIAVSFNWTKGELSLMTNSISSIVDKHTLIKLFNELDKRPEFLKQIDLRGMDVRTNGGRREANQDQLQKSSIKIQEPSSLGRGLTSDRSIDDSREPSK